MINLHKLPLFTYIILWIAAKYSYPKNVTSIEFVQLIESEIDDLKTVIRYFDMYRLNGKVARYLASLVTKYCNDRISKLYEMKKFMTLSISVMFIPFEK
jgi:hypothetical protein